MNGVDYYRDRRVNRSQYNCLTFRGKFWGGVIGVRLSACAAGSAHTTYDAGRSAGRIALHRGRYTSRVCVNRVGC